MLKFILIFTVMFIILCALMKAARKDTPVIPDIKNNKNKGNDDI